jgi:hypothetical protein
MGVCSETLSNKCMNPSLLKRLFEIKHENLVKKKLRYFERLLEDVKSRKKKKFFCRTNENAVKSSKISHLIVKAGKQPYY